MTAEFVSGFGILASQPRTVLQETEGVMLIGFALLTMAVCVAGGRVVRAIEKGRE